MDRYQCLKLVYSDSLSSFFTKLSKNNMGTSQGHQMPPVMPPSWGMSDNPHDTPYTRLVFSPNCQKITWGHHGGSDSPCDAPHVIF